MDYSFFNRTVVRGKYLCVVMVLLFAATLPLHVPAAEYISPDLILAFTFAWVLRRPDAMTPVVICAALLLSDFVLHRPPGAWTLIVLAATMFLRGRSGDMLYTMYSVEWILVALVTVLCFVVYQSILIVTFSGAQPLVPTVSQAVATIAVYPVITFISRRIMGVYKTGPADINNVRKRA